MNRHPCRGLASRPLRVGWLLTVGLVSATSVFGQNLTWDEVPQFGGRRAAPMAYDPTRERLVRFSGEVAGSLKFSPATWEWDGARWLPRYPTRRPPARYWSSMAFDAVRQTVVLFGGFTNDNSSPQAKWPQDFWEWNGQNWHELTSQVALLPPVRANAAMAADPVRRRILMFGGHQGLWGGAVLGDTWEWDGSVWRQMQPSTVPSSRYGASMAFCGNSGRLLLYGGGGPTSFRADQGYEWSGSDWIALPFGPPGYRAFADMTAMPWNGRVLPHGGEWLPAGATQARFLADTWEWDGSVWRQVQTSRWPASREYFPLAVHEATRQVVLNGGRIVTYGGTPGSDPADNEGATWLFTNGDWSRVVGLELVVPTTDDGSMAAAAADPTRDEILLISAENIGRPGPRHMTQWALAGGVFRQVSRALPMANRRYFACAGYHESLNRVVLFGGDGFGTPLSDTWAWNGANWIEDNSPMRPQPSTRASITYDPDRQALVMTAGSGRVLEWTGQGWTERVEASLPPSVVSGEIIYDRYRHRLMLFALSTTGDPGDWSRTWEFDGSRWNLVESSSPRIVQQGRMHQDLTNGHVLLRDPNNAGPLYRWTGSTWQPVLPIRPLADGCPASLGRGIEAGSPVYDPCRNELLLVRPLTVAGLNTESWVWTLRHESLTASTRHPRLGERLRFDLDLPPAHGHLAAVLFSGGTWPGIRLSTRQYTVLPLAADGLLQTSLSAGLFTVLDNAGRGQVLLAPIPVHAGLVGMQMHVAVPTLDLHTMLLGPVSNAVPIDIGR